MEEVHRSFMKVNFLIASILRVACGVLSIARESCKEENEFSCVSASAESHLKEGKEIVHSKSWFV
jgi:hypothetical protein